MDDDLIIRSIASSMLEALGHEVNVVSEGREAITLFEKERREGRPFHMVILDLYVPKGMSARETIKILRKISPDVYAVVSSGAPNDPYIVDFENHGFNGVLPKPYTIDQLKEVLKRAVEFQMILK